MRISDPNGNAKPQPAPAAEPPATHAAVRGRDAASGSIAVATDRAELSHVADRLAEILQSFSSPRSERVQRLKEQFAAGTYQVDTAAVSRALVNEALPSGGTASTPK